MKLNGIFKGIVESNADPKNRGRCKVRIETLHTNKTSVTSLPWAEPCMPFGGNESVSMIFIPPIKSKVWISFINNDTYSPIIVGYQRKDKTSVKIDYSKYYGRKQESLLYWKFGQKGGAPFAKFDSIGQKITFGADGNEEPIGKEKRLQGNRGSAQVELKDYATQLKFHKDSVGNDVILNSKGISLSTKDNLNEYVGGSKTTIVGASFLKNVPSAEMANLGLYSNLGDGQKIKASGAKDYLGEPLYNKILEITDKFSYSSGKTLYSNMILLANTPKEEETTKDVLIDIPSESKHFVKNLLNIKGERNYIKNLVEVELENAIISINEKKYENILGSEAYAENNAIAGSRRSFILGFENTVILQDKEEKVTGSHKLTTIADVQWKVMQNFGLLVASGDYKVSVGLGDAEMTFTNPLSVYTIQQGIGLSSPDQLVKKEAFDALVSYVMTLSNYLAVHTHMWLIIPTTPPTLPYPLTPRHIAKEIEFGIQKNLPSPINTWYTNNLEAS